MSKNTKIITKWLIVASIFQLTPVFADCAKDLEDCRKNFDSCKAANNKLHNVLSCLSNIDQLSNILEQANCQPTNKKCYQASLSGWLKTCNK